MAEQRCTQCRGKENLHVIYTLKSGSKNYRCRECNTKNHRRYRGTSQGALVAQKSVKLYRERNDEKIKAHSLVHNALKNGKLLKEDCRFCHSEISEAHHPDYSKPLEVIWVCRACHKGIHFGRIKLETYSHVHVPRL